MNQTKFEANEGLIHYIDKDIDAAFIKSSIGISLIFKPQKRQFKYFTSCTEHQLLLFLILIESLQQCKYCGGTKSSDGTFNGKIS
jgi:hypothetical protein